MFICTQRQSRYVRLDKSLIKKFNNKLFLFVAFSCHCMFSNTLTLLYKVSYILNAPPISISGAFSIKLIIFTL